MTDFVSVIVPIFNVHRPLLEACLDSVFKQTLRDNEYEIVLVDDCSSDAETLQVIRAHSSRGRNVKLIRHSENRGLNEARRSGVNGASGDYVLFVDGDDILTRDAIENLRAEAWKSRADLVTAPFLRWNNENKSYADIPIVAKPFPSQYLERLQGVLSGKYSFTMCGRLFRRSILTDSVFDLPRGQLHEDVTTLIRFMFDAQCVSHIHRPIYYYTLNAGSITNHFTWKHAEGMLLSIGDWISNAERHNILEPLADSMSRGAERLINTCVERCVFSDSLDISNKIEVLSFINDGYTALTLPHCEPSLQGVKFLVRFEQEKVAKRPEQFLELVVECFPNGKPQQPRLDTLLKSGMEPSEMALRLKDKVVFIGQVDYQIRNAATLAHELRLRGHPCVVLDNSAFASGSLRQLRPNESGIFWRTEHIKISKPPYGPDWLSTAKLVVAFNDFNDDFREALEYRHRLGLPSVCMVEGINDFLRVDFEGYRYLPYRRCDYVFLAGENDRRYFEDRQTYVVGLPIIEKLCDREPVFPEHPLAVLNVNFTYGALENEREGFVAKAKSAFEALGLDWVITQHPMDMAALSGLPVSKRTQYELIEDCTVFVSRFATGILEALASGKPVVYFNPHGEKVEKFKEPLGAFEIATNERELAQALRKVLKDVEAAVDFRERARVFLEHHTAYDPEGPSVAATFAEVAQGVMSRHSRNQVSVSKLCFERLDSKEKFIRKESGLVFGAFDRRHKAQLNEEELIGRYFADRGAIMIDVGANFGNSLDIYLGKGWTVHAFEPDPSNRKRLLEGWPSCERLIVNENAVSDKAGIKAPFFASDESTGISGLAAFTSGHKQICEVETTTLRDYYKKCNLNHVDFLKVDVEGYDKFVLDGFPWEKDKPEVVLAEFEDGKTVPLGYTTHDMAKVLTDNGYTVYVSEWLPIVRYGIAHDWKRMVRYSPDLSVSDTWGNILGFLKDPGEDRLRELTQQTVKFAARPSGQKPIATIVTAPKQGKVSTIESPFEAVATPLSTMSTLRSEPSRPFYAPFGDWLMARSPRLFRLMQFARRALAGLWRRRVWTLPALLFLAALPFLALHPALTGHEALVLGGAAAAILAFAVFYLALRVYQFATALSAETAALRETIADTKAEAATLRGDLENVARVAEASDAALKVEIQKVSNAAASGNETLKAEAEAREEAFRADLAALRQGIDQRLHAEIGERAEKLASTLQAAIDELAAKTESARTALKAELDGARKDLSGIKDKLGALESRSVSLHLAVALRLMRPLWIGGSAVEALAHMPEVEHGHELMMAVLADQEQETPGALAGKTLIEIGTTRENVPAQGSTQKLAVFTALTGMRFVTVDMDPANTKAAAGVLRYLNPAAQAVSARGENFLPAHPGPLEYVYLDAFDFDHPNHSETRRERYRNILHTDITDPACWKMHEDCAVTLAARMGVGGVVVLDDTWTNERGEYEGKGKLAMPLLLTSGFEIIARTKRTVALRRTAMPGAKRAAPRRRAK